MKYLLILIALAFGQKVAVIKTELHPNGNHPIVLIREYGIVTKILSLKKCKSFLREIPMFTIYEIPVQHVRTWHDRWHHLFWRPPKNTSPGEGAFFILKNSPKSADSGALGSYDKSICERKDKCSRRQIRITRQGCVLG